MNFYHDAEQFQGVTVISNDNAGLRGRFRWWHRLRPIPNTARSGLA
ncbi:MAG: hypothetical protein Ct9H300mP1_23770 [Planctomycetaceae bacterium]|nr:MAG: hypothetical protein Ct9H300mP1_23770 [Planctomycetaceae bacterium]